MEERILVWLTSDFNEIFTSGKALVEQAASRCSQDMEKVKLFEISNPMPAYYVLLEYNDCIADLISRGVVKNYIYGSDYEQMMYEADMHGKKIAKIITFEDEDIGGQCTII